MNPQRWGFAAVLAYCFVACTAAAQAPITLKVNTTSHGSAISTDFVGLSFETRSMLPNTYGVSGYFFAPANTQAVTLFQNIGMKTLRVGGGTSDGSGTKEHCMPVPTTTDVDNLFQFSQVAGIKVIYGFRLLNVSECANPNLATDNARIAQYIWRNYRASLHSFAIGNEPDCRVFHSTPDHIVDPAIYETEPGVAGSAYPSYLAAWRKFVNAILAVVPEARFTGPFTCDHTSGSFTPNRKTGVSWTQKFAEDEQKFGILEAAAQHHYVGAKPGTITGPELIENMLSPEWLTGTSQGVQHPGTSSETKYTPYQMLYDRNLAPVVAMGVPYRMTEANECLGGVQGASDTFAGALWALDYMHWWAAHGIAGVHFHNNPWILSDTIVPNPRRCPASGCKDYYVTPKGYGMKAFSMSGRGYRQPITVSNSKGINVTAYAAGNARELYVTIINKTYGPERATAADVTVQPSGFNAARVAYMELTDGEPGNPSLRTATLGGASITNNSRWQGQWTPLGPSANGEVSLTVPASTAAIVRIGAAGLNAGPIQSNQDGTLELFATGSDGQTWRLGQKADKASLSALENWSAWAKLEGEVVSRGGASVVKNLDNTLEVFVAGTNGKVYHNSQITPGSSWSGWADLGGAGITSLEAGTNPDGSLSVFGLDGNGSVWTNSQSAPGVGWTGWTSLSGVAIEAGFALGQNLNGRLELFGVDKRGKVWHNLQAHSGSWSGWNELAGQALNPHLAVASNLDGRLELFGLDKKGQIWRNWQTSAGGSWHGWSQIAGKSLKPGFVVGQDQHGRLMIFGVQASAQSGKTGSGVWSVAATNSGVSESWKYLGAAGMEPRLVVSNTNDGRIQLFGIGSDQHVWSNWQTSTGEWAGWTDFGGKGVRLYADSSR